MDDPVTLLSEPKLDSIFSPDFLELVASTDNDREQLYVMMQAFFVFQVREVKYHSLWQQYGAVDSYHHVTSKAARTQFYLEGHEDESDPLDLINYTVFLIRNMRAGRIHNSTDPRERFGKLFDDLLEMSPDQLRNLIHSLPDKQRDLLRGFLAGEIPELARPEPLEPNEPVTPDYPEVPIRNWQGEVPDGEWCCYSCDYHTSVLEAAASHAARNDDWVWLFSVDRHAHTEASFEMHPSDGSDGVYLNQAAMALTWNNFYRHRERRAAQLQKEHVD